MDTEFSVAVHTLVMLSESDKKLTSDAVVTSVGTNTSYIRKIISLLKKQTCSTASPAALTTSSVSQKTK